MGEVDIIKESDGREVKILDTLYELIRLTQDLQPGSLSADRKFIHPKWLAGSKQLLTAIGVGPDFGIDLLQVMSNSQRKVWPKDGSAFASLNRDEAVIYMGARGGTSSISEILKHLNALGSSIERPYLTTILNRMKSAGKGGTKALVRSVPGHRGRFSLTDDGVAEYATLTARP